MKIEDPESNDNEGSNKSSTTKDNDIKSRLRKHPNKTKILYTNELLNKKSKKNSWRDACREIVEALKKDEKSYLFRQPAIKSFSDPKDREYYKQQIKEPRDLGTISKKLKNESYTLKEFVEDIELCWSNALTFNDCTTAVYQCAVYLKELTNKLYKEKGIEDIIDKYNSNNNIHGEEKEIIMSDNTNISNNNTNDSNNTTDKINLSENNIGDKINNANNFSEQIDSIGSGSSNKSNKDDESYDGSELKKNNKNITGRKRGRPSNNKEETISIEKKRGRKKKKIENENTNNNANKIKRILNFEDIKKFYPINYPIIYSLEDIEKIIPKKIGGKAKTKKLVKATNKINENINNIKKGKLNNKQSSNKHDTELIDKKTNKTQSDDNKNKKSENEKTNNNALNENKSNKNTNNDVKIVNNANNVPEKNMELRTELGKYFTCLTDDKMIKVLVYIENIRPQSIRILENDTIYIDMEAFNSDTFKNVFAHLKNFFH